FVLSLLLAIGVKAIVGPVKNDGSGLHQVTSLIGTSVSGFFLYVIAAINFAVLLGILKVFRELKQGKFNESELESHLNDRGFVMRFFKKLTGSIRSPRQMYGVGLLFGLGFDTATEVAFLVLAGTGAASGLPGQEFNLGGGFWAWVEGLNINTLGFFIVGLFVVTWALAVVIWRAFGFERRYARPAELPEAAE